MARYRDRQDSEDRYYGDVIYEVWRSGGDPDAVDRSACRDYQEMNYSEEAAAAAFMPRHEHEAYPEEQYQEPNYPDPDYPEPDYPEENQ